MLPELERLLILQDRDRKLRALRNELKSAPLEQKAVEEKLAAAQKSLDALKLKGKETEVERKKLENEAETRRTQIAKFQTQKFQTRKNEEFQALSNEIARFEKEIREIEDRELELMESAEKQRASITEADREFAATKAQVARQTTDLGAKVQNIEGQLATLEAERAKFAEALEEDLADTYERLFATKNGEAIVPLNHDVCMGCHTKVTPSTAASARAGKQIVQCENCARLLYRGE